MKVSSIASVIVAVFIVVLCLQAQTALPLMKSVDPTTAKVGDLLTVTGEHLDKSLVAKVFLTDGTHDFEVAVSEQDATTIKFTVPAKITPGRFALMLETRGKDVKLIEQPVKVTIEQ
jgi:hypothetical protein